MVEDIDVVLEYEDKPSRRARRFVARRPRVRMVSIRYVCPRCGRMWTTREYLPSPPYYDTTAGKLCYRCREELERKAG